MNQKIFIVRALVVCALAMGSLTWGVKGLSLQAPNESNLSKASPPGQAAIVSDPAMRLDSLVVEVNGERRVVVPSQGFAVVLGDLVTIVDAYLVDKSTQIKTVDLIGFRSKVSSHPNDDRGRVIDTGRNLNKHRSVDGVGKVYRIDTSGPQGLYGSVLMTIHDPELTSIQLEVNGVVRTVDSQSALKLSPNDTIRILEVRTNVRGNENVRYDVAPKKGSRELRFSRGGRVFARIPIEWQTQ